MKMLMAAVALVMTVAAPSLTGSWTMSVTGGPHGDATMALTLKQDGAQVTGTFVSGHGPDMTMKGQFVNGELHLESQGDPDARVIFSARLRDDGTLSGSMSTPVGDMKWTAKRRA